MIRPDTIEENSTDNVALIHAHGGAAIFYNGIVNVPFQTKKAIQSRVIIFSVDYRKAPEHRSPCGQYDFYLAVKHIYLNAKNFGIDSSKIIVEGVSAGAWIAMGAIYFMVKSKETFMVNTLFLTVPMVNDMLSSLKEE